MNIGIVLSGGMAKGAYQIGALRAIGKFLPLEEIKYISCSSIGVLNGYAYISNNLDKAEEMWRAVCNDDTRMLISSLLKSSILQQKISELYCKDRPITIPFYCSLFDLNTQNIVYKDLSLVYHATLPQYLKASVAMPIYNKSVKIDNAAYFDGAIIDNIPVYPLVEKELDYLICIYFDDVCYKFENTEFNNKIIKITFPSTSRLKQSVVLKQDMINSMIATGYTKTFNTLSQVFLRGYDNLPFIYNSIQATQPKNKTLRITGDVFVTNLNKITQQLTKRKIL